MKHSREISHKKNQQRPALQHDGANFRYYYFKMELKFVNIQTSATPKNHDSRKQTKQQQQQQQTKFKKSKRKEKKSDIVLSKVTGSKTDKGLKSFMKQYHKLFNNSVNNSTMGTAMTP